MNAVNSYMYGIGNAEIIIFDNSLVKIDINLTTSPIVNDDGSTDFNTCLYYGIDWNIFKNKFGLPGITPVEGGSLIIYDNTNALDTAGMGWGGCWTPILERWTPARAYTGDGIIGGWPIVNMQNKRLIGTCYGYLS